MVKKSADIKRCESCGGALKDTRSGRKYCDGCTLEAYKKKAASYRKSRAERRADERKKLAEEKASFLSLSEMASQAHRHGMTYGQYSVALKNGTLKREGN